MIGRWAGYLRRRHGRDGMLPYVIATVLAWEAAVILAATAVVMLLPAGPAAIVIVPAVSLSAVALWAFVGEAMDNGDGHGLGSMEAEWIVLGIDSRLDGGRVTYVPEIVASGSRDEAEAAAAALNRDEGCWYVVRRASDVDMDRGRPWTDRKTEDDE